MSENVLPWPDFLASQGATRADPNALDALVFPLPADPQSGFASPLSHLGVISASGEDAQHFLHNQLTSDVLGFAAGDACLAGYCSPKGRLLATLLVWKDADEVLLALPRRLLPATLKRLQMFVLRSKVRLNDASDRVVLAGFAAPNPALPDWPSRPWQRRPAASGTLIRVPDAAGLQRCLWAGPPDGALLAWQQADLPPAPPSLWRWTEIMAGLPMVLEPTREQFVPQMINFELVGGVNFRKGCYPGQEIVARSQYLGKLKRRTVLAFTEDDSATAGVEVFSAADPSQPCGMIVNAEAGPDGRMACLVEIRLELASAPISLRAPEGPGLTIGELPYPLSDPA